MDQGLHIPYLREIVIFLVVAAVFIPVFHRLRISPIFGYLVVGTVIGPFGLGRLAENVPVLGYLVIGDVAGVAALAELGVVFLLFIIGLGLSYERLRALRRLVFGLGTTQLGVSAVVIGLVAWAWGNDASAAVVVGLALALSSTAIVTQILIDQGRFSSQVGRASFAILLFQDLAVAPILFLVSVLALPADGSLVGTIGLAAAKAALTAIAIIVLGRIALRPLFRLAANSRSPELFTALALLSVIGTAAAAGAAGLSMALGAFLAGLVLAGTEFHHQIEVDVAPFKGLLLGLFFVSVGMGIDVVAVSDLWMWLAFSVIGLYATKSLIIAVAAWAFDLPPSRAVHTGLMLGQSSEFAFVALGAAAALDVIARDISQFMIIVTSLSMLATPLVASLAPRICRIIESRFDPVSRQTGESEVRDVEGHVIIAGYGRVGQTIAHLLESQKFGYVALDLDGARILELRRRGMPVFYGDASRREVLERVGAGRAAALVVTLDHAGAAMQTVETARRAWPSLPVYVRARDTRHAEEMRRAEPAGVVPETVESSLQLGAAALTGLGIPSEAVNQLLEQIREREYQGLDSRTVSS